MTLSSYRHNTLTSYVGKTMKRILLKRVIDFLETTGQMDETQEGFRKQSSTGRYHIPGKFDSQNTMQYGARVNR